MGGLEYSAIPPPVGLLKIVHRLLGGPPRSLFAVKAARVTYAHQEFSPLPFVEKEEQLFRFRKMESDEDLITYVFSAYKELMNFFVQLDSKYVTKKIKKRSDLFYNSSCFCDITRCGSARLFLGKCLCACVEE